MPTRRHLIALSAASALAPSLFPRLSRAEDWPSRAVHMVVPITAGGPNDICARILAERLAKDLGQQVVVDNKSGAGNNIGNEFVAHSAPDGYTILFATGSLGVNTVLYSSLTYDPITDLAPISLVANEPFFMFVPNSSPAKSVAELIAYTKSAPSKLTIGSPGTGSVTHLVELLFVQMARIEMTHVPYRGAVPALADLIPGRIDCYFGSGQLLEYWRSGQVRALATTGAQRAAIAPELPTMAEAGVPGCQATTWQGLFAPAQTSPTVVNKINADTVAALVDPTIKNKLEQMGYSPGGSSPEQLAIVLKADIDKWGAIVKSAGIKLD
jgi:tripartite-type tricarboxylate transporter receptor subunit TctC